MRAASGGAQTFQGATHRIGFRFAGTGRPGGQLAVVFFDTSEGQSLSDADHLAGLDLHRLYVVDDFGVFADGLGYPGCWYLGEGGSRSYEADVGRLVELAMAYTGVPAGAVIGVGRGKGGFAATHFAIECGWGTVVAGSPHFRLGSLLRGEQLAPVREFLAGDSGRDARRALDRVLTDALAKAASLPAVHVQAGIRERGYGEQVEPLVDALTAAGASVSVTPSAHTPLPGAAGAAFRAYAYDVLAAITGSELVPAPLPDPEDAMRSRGAAGAIPRLTREPAGIRCFLDALPDDKLAFYVGLRAPVAPFAALRLGLSFRRTEGIQTITVDAVNARGGRVHRWRWMLGATWAPAGGVQEHLLHPGRPSGGFEPVEAGDPALVDSIEIAVRARGGRTVDFTLHTIATRPPASDAGAETELPLPAWAQIRPRRGQLTTDAAKAAQVAGLVASGAFPAPAVFPAGPVARPGLKVAGVLDPFSAAGFGYEFDLVEVTPEDFGTVLGRERPDLLLVESAWRGKDGSWNKLIGDSDGAGSSEALTALVEWCRRRGIPTVFWNKEDPPNFEHFVAAAGLFDHVFTTDVDCIPRYRERLGHDRLGVLPFAAQPRIHNPVDAVARPLDVAFLGTFYGRKHPDRKRQMELVLDPARDFGLHIYSRVSGSSGYDFPEKYRPHLVGTVPYERVLGAYRAYKVLLNVNSVIGSPTMCARRIFEILACGGSVLSGRSPAIEHMLGAGIVEECASHAETRAALARQLDDEARRARTAARAIRRVLGGHTYSHRVDDVLRAIGHAVVPEDRSVTLLAFVGDGGANADADIERLVDAVARQSHDDIDLVLITSAPTVDEAALGAAVRRAGKRGAQVVVRPAGAHDVAVVAGALQASRGRFAGFLNAAGFYGEDYVTDLLQAFRYTDGGVVGKAAHFERAGDEQLAVRDVASEHRYVDAVRPDAFLAHRETLQRLAPGPAPWRDAVESWQAALRGDGVRIYAADRFNFVAPASPLERSRGWQLEVFGAGDRHALA